MYHRRFRRIEGDKSWRSGHRDHAIMIGEHSVSDSFEWKSQALYSNFSSTDDPRRSISSGNSIKIRKLATMIEDRILEVDMGDEVAALIGRLKDKRFNALEVNLGTLRSSESGMAIHMLGGYPTPTERNGGHIKSALNQVIV